MNGAAKRPRALAAAVLGVALAIFSQVAVPQAFPSKPVRLITQFTAGSTGDVIARVLSSGMSSLLGQPVVVENRPGAGGVLAGELVARASPDGHTLLLSIASVQVLRVFVAKSTPFDPVKDFAPITKVGESVTCFVVHSSVPVNSFRELIDYARRNPGKLSYGTSGIGTQTHLAGELIKQLAGVDIVHVPYKAVAQSLKDAISGQLPTTFAILGLALPAHRSGKIKVLAFMRDAPLNRLLPDIPTVADVVPGFEPPPSWTGLFAPAGVQQPVIRRLHADAVKVLNEPGARSKLADAASLDVSTNTPEEFAALIRAQVELVGRVVKRVGIQPVE